MDRELAFQTSTGDVDADLFIDFLNEIEDQYYDLLIQANPSQFLTQQSVNTSAAVTIATAYTLDISGGGVFEADSAGNITNIPVRKTTRGSPADGYYTVSNTAEGGVTINWTPSTATTSRTRHVLYVPYRTVLTDGATTLFPSRRAHFVKRALLRYYEIWDRNTSGMLATEDGLFQSYLKQIMGNTNPSPDDADADFHSF